ncbi:molybdopterin synthase [Haloarchaeobius sp. TZWWS8]|uniref:molybdopterin synthase n=1 Tax=Haloarchaeobius sp. TZWWS8 TaxID=3446121 RepID=UPI003EBCDBD3
MHVLGVVGPSDSGKTTLVERLVDELDSRGRVATVKHCSTDPDIDTDGRDTARHRAAGATTTVGIAEDSWMATGDDRTLDETLADLAPDHDFCLLEGFSGATVPQVVLGGRDHAGEALAEGSEADDIDVTAVREELLDSDPYECLDSLVARVKRSPEAEKAGAIATFTGRVRAKEHDDDSFTESLTFEKYAGVAEERIATICAELEEREGVLDVVMHHRTGVIDYGEDIVFVVVLAAHRREAFRTVEDGIDRLKDEVPIFKKEVTTEEEFWVHDSA